MISVFLQGGLGNQLFQIAAGYAHAKSLGTNFALIEGQHHLPLQGNNVETYRKNILRKVDRVSRKDITGFSLFTEKTYAYQKLPAIRDLYLIGYFQTEKYFSFCKESIRNLFEITPKIHQILIKKYPFILDEKVISLHIRRGDYLKNPDIHTNLNLSYYHKALDSIDDKNKVIIFSDDIEWAKDNLPGFIYSDLKRDYLDLYLMTMCYHHIIANSSFSWWGAWLSNTKGKVIAPKVWFGPRGPQDYEDIVPESWIKIC